MFCQTPGAFDSNFQPENYLKSMEQIDCYKARAKAHNSRFPWSDILRPVWTATLVHTSANVPGKVAYYSSITNLMMSRLTRTSPEMFLERILQYAPAEIRAAWGYEVLGNVLPTVLFIANTDPDGWINVYERGPHSCMQGDTKVAQYAHKKNNLNLAYMQDGDKITHRTIVNTKKKTYIRVYGNNPGEFIASLNKLGYRQDHHTLEGEIIHLDYSECQYCEREMLIGPYIDGAHQGIAGITRKEGKIGGFIEMEYGNEYNCGECGDEDNDDN
jgi:hypothetical protein